MRKFVRTESYTWKKNGREHNMFASEWKRVGVRGEGSRGIHFMPGRAETRNE